MNLKNEPVLKSASIPAILLALYAFLKAMGWIHFTQEQETALLGFAGALVPIIAGIYARGKVSPV